MSSGSSSVRAVLASPQAIRTVAQLSRDHGPVLLHLSGGCCDGTAPQCLLASDFVVGPSDVLVGHVGSAPMYIDRDQWRRWGEPSFRVDVFEGPAGGFSLEVPLGLRFTATTIRPP